MNFKSFKDAVGAKFSLMSKSDLFRTTVDKDQLWDTYLQSFPEGTNPIYKERTEHDCSACRHFIKSIGNVVAIVNGDLVSIWDVNVPEYQPIADALSALVKSKPIENIFLHPERTTGVNQNFQQLLGNVVTFDHFFASIPTGIRNTKKYYMPAAVIGPALSEAKAQHDVLLRSLEEITDDAINTVLELIAQNTLYRGTEKKSLVEAFKSIKAKFGVGDKDRYVWSQLSGPNKFAAKIRNDVIGTLLVELSEGVELERAVAAFEAKVAPANYKRPTALVTPMMIKKAQEKIEELGLTSALGRRYANLTDITANNILYADRTVKPVMAGTVFDELIATAPVNAKKLDNVQEIEIDKFISDILPTATSVEIMLDNSHMGNLVSLIAPTDPTAGLLFKWPNNFSWSYNGQLADSIKERVKKAGGNVTGDLCCRLAWNNTDDLDLHMLEPDGTEIFYGNKRSKSGGELDVDMNVTALVTNPVENIFYLSDRNMKEGVYKLFVNQYTKRNNDNFGFDVEIDYKGSVTNYSYNTVMSSKKNVTVAEFKYTKATGIEFITSLPTTTAGRDVWGLRTQTFHKVNLMMLSPNHWDDKGIGNKHYFFVIDGCQNDDQPRGFFNEFLSGELEPHRKVFELVGSKVTVPNSTDQLSGLGFSSTQRSKVLCKVTGSFSRIIKIVF